MKNPFEGSPYRGITDTEKVEMQKRELRDRFRRILEAIQKPDGMNSLSGNDHDFGDDLFIFSKTNEISFASYLNISPEAAEFVRDIPPSDWEAFRKHWIMVY
ncbi:hypothetical protein IT407_04630 [Candidatus Uhrbacteria bacterium]|nr:hypothetical protein [Candidatus Uhrbacteria bacterium]